MEFAILNGRLADVSAESAKGSEGCPDAFDAQEDPEKMKFMRREWDTSDLSPIVELAKIDSVSPPFNYTTSPSSSATRDIHENFLSYLPIWCSALRD